MRSDHWNFLANLLGTSGSSDSPKKKAPKPKPVVPSSEPEKSKAESAPSSSSLAHDSKESNEGGFGSSERPQRRHAPTPVTSESSGDSPKNVEDVLDALRSATPPQKIPGFGPPKKTEAAAKPAVETSRPADTAKRQAFQDRPRDPVGTASLAEKSKPTDPEDASLDRAWGSLANQLGVSVDKDFSLDRDSLDRESKPKTEGRQERKPSVSRDRDSASADRDSASAAQPKRSGFGTGLVDNSDQDVVDSDSGFGAPRRAKPAPQSRERSAEPKSSTPRTRETESGEESSGKFISKKSSFEDKDSERGERGPRRRGRRRGVRQRMTEDDLDRNEGSAKSQEDAPKAAREDQPRRGGDSDRAPAGRSSESSDDSGRGRDRGGRGRSSRDSSSRDSSSRDSSSRDSQRSGEAEGSRRQRSAAKSTDEPSNRSERSRPARGRDAEHDFDDDFGPSLFVDDIDDDELLVDDAEVTAKTSDSESDRDEDSPRPRSRRRGRRGGRRGRSRDESTRSEDEVKSVDADDSVDDIADGFGELPSFAVDIEDDDDDDSVRREKSRSQSGRGSRGNREPKGRDSSAKEDSADGGSRSRGRGRRNESSADDAERPTAPTWLETVSILVDSNVENHKKTPARGGGGGGRGRGGKRR